MKKLFTICICILILNSNVFAESILIWAPGTKGNTESVIEYWTDIRTPDQYDFKFVKGDTKEQALQKRLNSDSNQKALNQYIENNKQELIATITKVKSQGYEEFLIQTPLGTISSKDIH